ncbi:MAG: hypothetical protein GY801_39585, partial [bacterium]|nr:hypothetical protein [bacterium]
MNIQKTIRPVVCVLILFAMAVCPSVHAGLTTTPPIVDDEWTFSWAPMYLWAVDLGGDMTVKGMEMPIDVEFSDAVENLQMVFTSHFEARKNMWAL